MMKKILSLFLICLTVFSLSACDLDSLPEDNKENNTHNVEQNADTNENPDTPTELSWDKLELPNDFPRLSETVTSFNVDSFGYYNFKWEDTDLENSQAKVDKMCEWANGRITGSVVGKTTTWKIQNDKINLTASFDEESGVFVIMTSVSEASGLFAYLAAHTLTEEDFKPANFTEFGELITMGEKFGGITQNGEFEIHIKDGTYSKEDAAAWCDAVIKKIVEISAANDNVVTDLRNNPITNYEEYSKNDGGIPDYPSIGCYFASELDGKDYMVKIIGGYYKDEGVYHVMLSTMRRIF